MAGIFDLIPIITVVLFALGLIGVIVYARLQRDTTAQSNS